MTATPISTLAPPPVGSEPAAELEAPAPTAAAGERNVDAWSQLDDRCTHLVHRHDDDDRRVLAVLTVALDERRGAIAPTIVRRWLQRHGTTIEQDSKWWGLVHAARQHLDLDQAARRRPTSIQIGVERLSCQGPIRSARGRTVVLPAGGHQFCPLVATWVARFIWSVASPLVRRLLV